MSSARTNSNRLSKKDICADLRTIEHKPQDYSDANGPDQNSTEKLMIQAQTHFNKDKGFNIQDMYPTHYMNNTSSFGSLS